MTARRINTRSLAIAMASMTAAFTAAALVMQASGAEPDVAETLLVSSFALLGLIVALRVPRNRLGWFFLGLAVLNSFASAGSSLMLMARDVWDMPNLAKAAVVASSWEWFAFLGSIATFALLLFPDGRLPSPKWRWVARIAGAAIALGCLLLIAMTLSDLDLAVADPEADTVGPAWLNVLVAVSWFALLACALASFASLVVRWRQARGVQRQQFKWFLFGGFVQILGIACGFTENAVLNALGEAAILSLPVAATLAILRYRLYDIDRIISRTLAWTLLTVVLGGVYLGGITLVTRVTAAAAGDSAAGVAAATLVTAAAFGPVRRRVQAAVDQRFNRARYDAARTAEAYRGRLREQLDLNQIHRDLVDTVAAAVQPRAALLVLFPTDGGRS